MKHGLWCALVMVLMSSPLPALGQPGLPSGLEVRLAPKQQQFGADEPILVEFLLTNTTGASIDVLKWKTPFDGIFDDMFRVARGAQTIPYVGPLAKRGKPMRSDFLTVAPNSTMSIAVDLSAAYAVYEAGPYSVVYDPASGGVHVTAPASGGPPALRKAAVRTNAATFEVTASRVRPRTSAAPATAMVALAPSFDHCSPDQKSQAQAALPEAVRISGEAVKALQGARPNDRPKAARYKAWFGLYTDTRYAKVKAHFDKIHDALANKAVSFDCGCKKANTYAYVYPSQPYKIFLCPKFWSAPAKGNATDSRPGTLVHETSHFNVVAGTDDFVYDQEGAAALALDDPDQAVMNADNHEYFAENTPPKPMK